MRKILYGEACNVSRTVLVIEVEVMFGVGLDEIQETEQTQPSSHPIFVCKSCETKLQNIVKIQNQVVFTPHYPHCTHLSIQYTIYDLES